MLVSQRLPDFPWDQLSRYAATAREHPGGIVDLSIGTPVDPTPEVIRSAVRSADNSPGYPTTWGRLETRVAVGGWLERVAGVPEIDPANILPAIGSKELIASLPLHLGIGPGDLIVYPKLAYPTYQVGASLVGAKTLASDSLAALGPERPRLLWLNSPSNPTGQVLPLEHLRKVVQWCQEREVVLVSDECYLECYWQGDQPRSILDPEVSGGNHQGLLAVHSLSKRSNLAGYRCAFVVGDGALVGELLSVRKNLGLMMPLPQQVAMQVALTDDAHVVEQRHRYRARRARLAEAVTRAGFDIEHSEAALYLWLTRGENCWQTVQWFAEHGILVAPGSFYGSAGGQHVRMAFTASDERVAAAAARLSA